MHKFKVKKDPNCDPCNKKYLYLNQEKTKKTTTEKLIQQSIHEDDIKTLEGLKGILNSRSIWFTHTSTLNDPLELKYGKQIILDILNEATNNENEDNIKNLLKNLSVHVNAFNTMITQTYVACFCESENLLSQWRSYAAQGGGYNLGLRFQSNTKYYHTLDDTEEDSYVILRKMVYDVDEQRGLISDYISSIVTSSGDAIKHYNEHGGIPDAWAAIAGMESANILFDLVLSFKNPVFNEENEWRLIYGRLASYKPEQLKFRETKEGLIPYIETYIVEDLEGKSVFPLSSIKFGPMLDDARTKSALQLFVNKEAVSDNKISINVNDVRITGAGYELRN